MKPPHIHFHNPLPSGRGRGRFLLLIITLLACTLPARIPDLPDPLETTPPTRRSDTPTPTSPPTPTITPTPLPQVRLANADRLLFEGDYDAAKVAFQTALTSSTEPAIQAAAQLGLGRVAYLNGDLPTALDHLRLVTSIRNDPSLAFQASYFLGRIYSDLQRYAEAADALGTALSLRPGALDAHLSTLRGDALTSLQDYPGALAAYQAAANSPHLPGGFEVEFKLAQTYALTGDYFTALVVYDDILNRSDSGAIKAQADYYKGSTYLAMGQSENAHAAFLDAVINYPTAYASYLGLIELVNAGYPVDELQRGLVDYYASEYGVALAAFDRYLDSGTLDPSGQPVQIDRATALFYRAMIVRDQGDVLGAVTGFDQVIQEHPEHALWDEAWEEKAYTQWAYLDDYLSASTTLLEFVQTSPMHPRAAEFLSQAARVAERDNRLEEAAQTWERIPNEYGSSEAVFDAIFQAGIARYRISDFAGALADFTAAAGGAMDVAQRSQSSFWMGKAQAALGDDAAALATWEQTASLDPTGYYSERAHDLLVGRQPFATPEIFDLGIDLLAERREAEDWLRRTFSITQETDLTGPGGLAGDPRLLRGIELWQLGEYPLAQLEFESLRMEHENDPAQTYRLMNSFYDLGLYRSAILAARRVLSLAGMDDAATLTAPPLFNHIRFGAYYPAQVVPLATPYGFHPLFAWSVMRQESLFEGFINSSAGAQGLMQIMPSTAESIVNRLGWPPNYTSADLYRPLVSLRLGLDYLAQQRDQLGSGGAMDLFIALAAYNGGPGNAAIWKELAQGDPDLLVEVIRFSETRRYLKSIYEIFSIYRLLYDRSP